MPGNNAPCHITACTGAQGPSFVTKIRARTDNQVDHDRAPRRADALTLEELVEAIEKELKQMEGTNMTPHCKRPVFHKLLERYDGDMQDLERFAFADTSKNYTRNLISTDNETYALILIVWNKGKYSPIHDHPCDGCWVKVIDGAINEVQYREEKGKLVEISNLVLDHGVTYMNDSIGLHKIGNPSDVVDAITVHLYSPPYDKCRIWFDTNNAAKSSVAFSYYFSEFGERADY
ncbi:TPA: hypothetical protein N0F65_006977 [Lagenidium giganteum]|uniref:Cysteine dioxygenase n=1 Tax=Lagenidium giganteum TaxID=4803 RepID=A0AAV2ZH97_9STRA|nr:TPA: hypothetical protein N0F65_006977 [Lagenidium giganteum]